MTDRNPALWKTAFACPHCKAFAQQKWSAVYLDDLDGPPVPNSYEIIEKSYEDVRGSNSGINQTMSLIYKQHMESLVTSEIIVRTQTKWVEWAQCNIARGLHASECMSCKKTSLWVGGKVIYPLGAAEVPDPNVDMPDTIKADYHEAAKVLAISPRSSAALLRLVIQKLCEHVLDRKGTIDGMIGDLVKQGLNTRIQKALDIVRVIGNEAVHPGQVDLRDDTETATALFRLVNIITESMISEAKHVEELYENLPSKKLEGIKRRDAKARPLELPPRSEG